MVWDEIPDRVRVSETLSQPVNLEGIDNLDKIRTSRPPSALLLESTHFLSLCDLFFQMKSKKDLLTCVVVGSLTNRDKAGYMKRDKPYALEGRTLPRTDKSL